MTTASKKAQTDTAAVPHRKSRAGLRPKPLASIGALDGLGPQSAIEKAKLDWESTADALAALGCLLGHKGQVMRTNRVVEDWALGTVAGGIGKTAHALPHPGLTVPRCTLNAFF